MIEASVYMDTSGDTTERLIESLRASHEVRDDHPDGPGAGPTGWPESLSTSYRDASSESAWCTTSNLNLSRSLHACTFVIAPP
jgi:hypothetical protein